MAHNELPSADTVSPAQSSLWGFGRAAVAGVSAGCGADWQICPAGGADEWSRLIDQVVAASPGEDQIALREHAVYVPRLISAHRAAEPRHRWNCVLTQRIW